MKKFIDNNLKKIAIGLIGLVIVLVVVLIIALINRGINHKSFENEIFAFNYDTGWRIIEEEANYVKLRHGKNGFLEISVKELPEELRFNSLDSLIREIEFGINLQNESYSLIAEEQTRITNRNLNSYRYLYEKDDEQALVVISKVGEKIIAFTYRADTDYFDILLDSVHNIIHSFELNRGQFALNTEIKEMNLTNINWTGNFNVNDTKEYHIATNNYLVNYKLPEQFQITGFNNTFQQFTFRDEENDLRVAVSVRLKNIYEWLHSDDFGTLQREVSSLEGSNENVKLETTKNSLFEGSYIHRITYETTFGSSTTSHERIYMIFPLDHIRIFQIEINSRNSTVSHDIINNIDIVSKRKIASYIHRNIEDGFVVNEMKAFISFGSKNFHSVTLRTPAEWREKAHTMNVYETRRFGLNCSVDFMNECEYNLSYSLGTSSSGIETVIGFARDDFTDAPLRHDGTFTYNGIPYEIFNLEYEKRVQGRTNQIIKFYETILYRQLEGNGYFIIKLNRMNERFDASKINEVLNYDITRKVYN